ncbi:hypothetical protein [Streptomyces sp. KL116D]|uniref:hypothetical protein n=1 Tax=Streptomyces sp. KL116D TaxID=3045152 RepID=UPI0035584691
MSGTYWGHGGPYELWVDGLRRWAADDGGDPVDVTALPPLVERDYPRETWQRITAHLAHAHHRRLQAWADRLVAAMSAADDEFTAGRELTHARAGLRALRSLATHPGLPEGLRAVMTDVLDKEIARTQAELERQLDAAARRGADPAWVEQRRRTLRDNGLTAVTADDAPPPGPDPWAAPQPDRPRRRIVLD